MATGDKNPCVCGCGELTGSTFAGGCDHNLVLSMLYNSPEDLARVNWSRLNEKWPKFHEGKLDAQIEWHIRYQQALQDLRQGATNAETGRTRHDGLARRT